MFEDKVLVFDLDGTLYADVSLIGEQESARILHFFMRKLRLNKEEAEAFIVKIRSKHYYDVDAFGHSLPLSKKEFLDYICDVDVSCLPINEKLNELLREMSQPKYILTDSTRGHVKSVLHAIGVEEAHFKDVFDADAMDYDFKYTGGAYRRFFERYGFVPNDCVMFEDNKVNIKTAKKAGMITVLIRNTDEHCSYADFEFKDINTALEYFRAQPVQKNKKIC